MKIRVFTLEYHTPEKLGILLIGKQEDWILTLSVTIK